MQAFQIDVSQIEEWQMIGDTDSLDRVFAKAQVTLVGGEVVQLCRKAADGRLQKFDEITTLDDLAIYKKNIYKYL